MKRILVLLTVFVVLVAPRAAGAQAPALLSIWTNGGTHGLGRPWHLGLDAAGHVYVSDPGQHRVFAFAPDGTPLASWDCPVLSLLDFDPEGLAVGPAGPVYVTTPFPSGPAVFLLGAFTTGGDWLGALGSIGSGPGQLGRPTDVARDAAGNLYLADDGNLRVEVLSSAGDFVAQWGSYGSAAGQFEAPLAIAVGPDGLVYVTDDVTQRVEAFTASGAFVRQWGSYGSGPGQLAGPRGIALDAAGDVYVADTGNDRIEVFDALGRFLAQWGAYGSGPGQFDRPSGVGIGPDGRIYVADSWNSRIEVFEPLPTPVARPTWGALKSRFR